MAGHSNEMEILGLGKIVLYNVIEWENPWKTIYKDLVMTFFPWDFRWPSSKGIRNFGPEFHGSEHWLS